MLPRGRKEYRNFSKEAKNARTEEELNDIVEEAIQAGGKNCQFCRKPKDGFAGASGRKKHQKETKCRVLQEALKRIRNSVCHVANGSETAGGLAADVRVQKSRNHSPSPLRSPSHSPRPLRSPSHSTQRSHLRSSQSAGSGVTLDVSFSGLKLTLKKIILLIIY
jgi:hypothetical protein